MGCYSIFLPLVEVNSLNSLILNTPIFNISNGKDEKSSLPFLLPDTFRIKQILKYFYNIFLVNSRLNLKAKPATHPLLKSYMRHQHNHLPYPLGRHLHHHECYGSTKSSRQAYTPSTSLLAAFSSVHADHQSE